MQPSSGSRGGTADVPHPPSSSVYNPHDTKRPYLGRDMLQNASLKTLDFNIDWLRLAHLPIFLFSIRVT